MDEMTVLALFGEILKNQLYMLEALQSPRRTDGSVGINIGDRLVKSRKQIYNIINRLKVLEVLEEDKLTTVAMAKAGGDHRKAAELLGISAAELRRRIKERTERDEG